MAIRISHEPAEAGIECMIDAMRDVLGNNQQILWLVSGGSNISIATEVARQLGNAAQGFVRAALVDERFGPVGHPDSNYQKLLDAGFEDSGIALTPVLLPAEETPEAAASRYARTLQSLVDEVDVVIAELGIGSDGHTAGVLPHTAGVESTELVVAYQGPDFQRITLTLAALRRIDTAFVFCYGADKAQALRNLVGVDTPLAEQPAAILKQIKSVYLYNDQIGGKTV